MKAPGGSFCFSPVSNSRDLGREVGNFGMDQLQRDMGRAQRCDSCVLTIGTSSNVENALKKMK